MRRRALCRSLVAGAALLAGCSRRPGDQPGADHRPPQTERSPPSQNPSTAVPGTTTTSLGQGLSVGLETDESGDEFVVTAVVANNRETAVDLTLVAIWTLEGERREGTARVQLDAGETGRYEYTFPEFGSISFEWREPDAATTPDDGSRRAPPLSRR